MTYDAKRKAFVIPACDMERASDMLLWAMAHVRKIQRLPLGGYSTDLPMDSAEFAQSGIFDAARSLGIDFNAQRYNEVDLRKHT